MSDYPVFISMYYGRDPQSKAAFGEHGASLRSRCRELGIPCRVEDVDDAIHGFVKREFGHLSRVVPRKKYYRYIPFFIRSQLTDHSILFIHCDSVIRRRPPPKYFQDVDVGYAFGTGKGGREQLLASPIYFRPGKIADIFLKLWMMKCRLLNIDYSEHKPLGTTTKDFSKESRVHSLPPDLSSREKNAGTFIWY